MISRLPSLLALAACLLPLTGHAQDKSEPRQPNVLIVLLDDLGFSDLGCYGGEIPTPNIDSLAKGGLRFTHMANSARCCPSRASLLTGLHPAQAGIPNFKGELSRNSATLAEVLKASGYATYAVGKWHVGNSPATLPTARGFDEFYGYTNGHSAGQWKPANYRRLPANREPELKQDPDKFYATDVFTDYTLEFIRQADMQKKPWLVYLAHSSPHFPLQAPVESAEGFVKTYERGWDMLREERFNRQKEIGLINGGGWKLTPRSLVPVTDDVIANGYPGKENPAWDALDEARRLDLAQRMALYAAMVKHVDEGMGRIVSRLKETSSLENTLILLLSDNGACYEWGPFGFDGVSRAGKNVVHPAGSLDKMGGPGSHISYGSGWANLSNTPFRLYKHYAHEGGTNTPFVVHWPAAIASPGRWVRERAQITDVMPTLVEAASATYPAKYDGHDIPREEGVSLLPVFRKAEAKLPERAICIQHEGAASIQKGQWKLVIGKRFPDKAKWELYDIRKDPVEVDDLAASRPDLVDSLSKEWKAWAARTGTPYDFLDQ